MSLAGLFDVDSAATGQQVRAEPIQRRSAERLSTLLDAAAEAVDAVGFDRITTAMIAERAGASIGTVYRYYPDRVAVLQALHERTVLRFRQRVVEEFEASPPASWWDVVDCAVTAFVGLYRSEPGFRIMQFADRERANAAEGVNVESGFFATRLAIVLADRFGLPDEPQLIFRVEIAVEMANSLLCRAFLNDPLGDDRFIDECRRVVHDYLASFYGAAVAVPVAPPIAV
ncbi:TetR/AcrR family transcriptional regulator [Cryobacterium frigoriphilum]|uniref:TetR/AcrR family transcriptional regulator n=1 Tax=Cryobacterium frigoriphilum TaxID=1259150 RepID=A0A4R9A3Q0_9MICO|nr:TetR/AcrR family transcriptional regulator [Cryobacterium frigoriphilum]TFD51602.1 TetR/AcrR family transcriptional regulator [Cryobacterium frigoriphilum]